MQALLTLKIGRVMPCDNLSMLICLFGNRVPDFTMIINPWSQNRHKTACQVSFFSSCFSRPFTSRFYVPKKLPLVVFFTRKGKKSRVPFLALLSKVVNVSCFCEGENHKIYSSSSTHFMAGKKYNGESLSFLADK